jgi:hypothetical protein
VVPLAHGCVSRAFATPNGMTLGERDRESISRSASRLRGGRISYDSRSLSASHASVALEGGRKWRLVECRMPYLPFAGGFSPVPTMKIARHRPSSLVLSAIARGSSLLV